MYLYMYCTYIGILLEQEAPVFGVQGSQVRVIYEPADFYQVASIFYLSIYFYILSNGPAGRHNFQ